MNHNRLPVPRWLWYALPYVMGVLFVLNVVGVVPSDVLLATAWSCAIVLYATRPAPPHPRQAPSVAVDPNDPKEVARARLRDELLPELEAGKARAAYMLRVNALEAECEVEPTDFTEECQQLDARLDAINDEVAELAEVINGPSRRPDPVGPVSDQRDCLHRAWDRERDSVSEYCARCRIRFPDPVAEVTVPAVEDIDRVFGFPVDHSTSPPCIRVPTFNVAHMRRLLEARGIAVALQNSQSQRTATRRSRRGPPRTVLPGTCLYCGKPPHVYEGTHVYQQPPDFDLMDRLDELWSYGSLTVEEVREVETLIAIEKNRRRTSAVPQRWTPS